jgi:molecular chaperone GrpE
MSKDNQNTETMEAGEAAGVSDNDVRTEDMGEGIGDEVERLRQDLAAAQEQVLRKAAEFQNYRRRTEEEKRLMVDIGRSSVIERLLDVVDDFARMIEASEKQEASGDSLRTGVELIYRKLMEELKKLGVEPIETVGKPFDENTQEAIMRQPAPEGTEPGTVLHEAQRGYMMKDRVLRHARVIVASDEA